MKQPLATSRCSSGVVRWRRMVPHRAQRRQGKCIKNALQTARKRLSLGFLSGESDDWQFRRAFLGVTRPPNRAQEAPCVDGHFGSYGLCGGQRSGRLGGDCGVWTRLKLEWLRRFIPLKNGVPSHDCIAYVISRLSPEGFRRCFMRWTEEVREKTAGGVIRGGWQNRPWLAGSGEEPQSAAQG